MSLFPTTRTSVLPQTINGVTIASTPLSSVSMKLSHQLSPNELVGLCQTISNAFPERKSRIIQFVSAYDNEGVSAIAFETALAAATHDEQRVLLIDTLREDAPERQNLVKAVRTSLASLMRKGGSFSDAAVAIAETNMTYAVLCGIEADPVSFDTLGKLLESLRSYFDLIVIASPAVLSDVVGNSIAKMVDGSILVVEAERIREPVAQQAKKTIEEKGGRVLGAILNRRQFYIPKWFYHLI